MYSVFEFSNVNWTPVKKISDSLGLKNEKRKEIIRSVSRGVHGYLERLGRDRQSLVSCRHKRVVVL